MYQQWKDDFSGAVKKLHDWAKEKNVGITTDAELALQKHIEIAVREGLISSRVDLAFVTAVEGLTAISLIVRRKENRVTGSTIEEALRMNHGPSEPPWKSVTRILERKNAWIKEYSQLEAL